MQRTDLSFQQIYNQLLTGSKLVLYFPDKSQAETFRTRMHHHKSKQDSLLEKLGLASAEERTVLNFKVKIEENPETTEAPVIAYIQFARPSPLKKYPVMIIEEKDLQSGTEVSGDLAAS
jgi:hypothetical protein